MSPYELARKIRREQVIISNLFYNTFDKLEKEDRQRFASVMDALTNLAKDIELQEDKFIEG